MVWFMIALLVAIGGIWTFYVRSKRMAPIDAAAARAAAAATSAPADPTRINVNDPADLARWTRELGVDEWDLKGAVQDAGPNAEAVRKHLRDR